MLNLQKLIKGIDDFDVEFTYLIWNFKSSNIFEC